MLSRFCGRCLAVGTPIAHTSVMGSTADLSAYASMCAQVIVAIGNNALRESLVMRLALNWSPSFTSKLSFRRHGWCHRGHRGATWPGCDCQLRFSRGLSCQGARYWPFGRQRLHGRRSHFRPQSLDAGGHALGYGAYQLGQ